MKKDFLKPLISIFVLEDDEIISTSGDPGNQYDAQGVYSDSGKWNV